MVLSALPAPYQAAETVAANALECYTNTKNFVLGMPTIYRGSVNQTALRVGELFREAVRHNETAMIVVHNHPSGNPTPSTEDVAVTRTLVEAGALMEIEVLDHLVIGIQRYVSMKERRLGFK